MHCFLHLQPVCGIRPATNPGNMGTLIRNERRIWSRRPAIVITIISLIGRSAVAGLTNTPSLKPDRSRSLSSYSLPSKIVTTDGKVYQAVSLAGIEPDGLLVQYRPAGGGIGMALLKFSKLPASFQKEFGYDSRQASAFEHAQALATFAMAQRLRKDEKIRAAMLSELPERPDLARAVSVNSPAPTVTYTYYAPGHQPATFGPGYSQCQPHYRCHATFAVHSQPGAAGQPFHFYIDKVTISLGLSCHIIEPRFPYDHIRIEQEGNRKIYEYFYGRGPPVARHIGDCMIGKEFTAFGPDIDAAKKAALARAEAVVQGVYSARVTSIAYAAGKYYSKLLDYGQNNFSCHEAVQEAIAKYANQINLNFYIRSAPPPAPGNPAVPAPGFQTSALH